MQFEINMNESSNYIETNDNICARMAHDPCADIKLVSYHFCPNVVHLQVLRAVVCVLRSSPLRCVPVLGAVVLIV